MSQALQSLARKGLAFTDGTGKPASYYMGLPLEANGTVAIDTTSAVDHYSQGIPLTANSRIAADVNGVVDYFATGTTPLTAASRLAITAITTPYGVGGVLFAPNSQISTGLYSGVERTFLNFDPVLNSYCQLATPVTLSGDFEISIDFSWVDFTTNGEQCVLTGDDGNTLILIKGVNNASSNAVLVRLKGQDDVVFYNVLSGNSALSTIKLSRISTTLSLDVPSGSYSKPVSVSTFNIEKLGVRNINQSFFNGTLASPKITDLSGTTPVTTTFRLDRPTGNTETSLEGNNSLTYFNIPESNRELFTLSNNGTVWNNTSPLPHSMPDTIEVA